MMKFSICLDHQMWNEKPKPQDVGYISSRIGSKEVQVTQEELARHISCGQTWTPATFIGGQRNIRNFNQISALGLDLDDLPPGFDINELLDIFDFQIIHKTFSWTPERPKYRAIAILDDTIYDANLAKASLLYLQGLFLQHDIIVDNSCLEVSRLFFGGKSDCIVHYDECNWVLTEDLDAAITPEIWNKVNKNKLKQVKDLDTDDKDLFNEISALSSHKRTLFITKFTLECERLRTFSGPGHRYCLVFNSARVLGSIATLPRDYIEAKLIEAIRDNPHFHSWDKNPSEIIQNAITWARQTHGCDDIEEFVDRFILEI